MKKKIKKTAAKLEKMAKSKTYERASAIKKKRSVPKKKSSLKKSKGSFVGKMKGSVLFEDDLLAPIGEKWNAD